MLLLPSLFTLPSARRGSAALLAVAAGLSLSACTTAPSGQTTTLKGEEGAVQAVVDRFSDRADDDDAKGICSDSLTPAAASTIAKGADCAAAVQKLIDQTDLTALDVDSVTITGANAVAVTTRIKTGTDQIRIVLEKGTGSEPWRIAAFGNAAAKAIGGAPSGTSPAGTSPKSTSPAASTPAE